MPSRSVVRPVRVHPERVHRKRALTALVLVALLAAPPIGRSERPNEPPYFAIRNARIVPVSGPVIEKGTIVISKGLITAVGTNVPIPPEAWVIEGEGLTVYPGLIDALTNLGLQAAAPPGREGGGAGSGPPGQQQQPAISRGPEDRPATTDWENAADQLNLSDKRIEEWRKAGFTSAVTVNDRGILPGQAAFINLGGERPNQMVVRTPVALRVNLTPFPGFFNFPGSLMGVMAYVKQLFLDADQYAQARALYDAQPAGNQRPAYDRALEPIRQAVANRWPVLIPATWSKEILRAIAFGEDLRANTLLYGAQQGYETADTLAAKKLPVLVSVKWPEKAKDADPEAEEPLRVLRFRERVPSTPAALQKAGVRFAFYSDGLTAPRDILKNVKKAIDAGLTPEAALRALTLTAAEIYGVSDRLGSLEPGKIANLVVTDGDLFAEKTKVKMVFVDGWRYENREPGKPSEPPAANLTGHWKLTLNVPQGPEERTADLAMADDGALSGSVTGPRGTASITSGWVSGNKFSFTLTMGPRTAEATYTGTVEGNQLSGTVSVGGFSADFTGTKPQD